MPPNLLLIQTDDHGQWALGCYGSREIRTPSLDHLAATGVRMCNAFTPSPMCSPGRASLWTGRIPSQHGLHNALAEHVPAVRSVRWLEGERTLAHIFREAGYVTGLSGKWHLGRGDWDEANGFDYWYSHSLPLFRPDAFRSKWTRPAADRTLPTGQNLHAIADHAIDFLRVRDRDRPFFLYVGPIATHSPWTGRSERLVRQYRSATFSDIPDDPVYPFGRLAGESLLATRADEREARAQYYAAVSEIDEQVGRILDELDAQGLLENTLVVYTSDHGLNTGHHGVWGKGVATEPYNMLEESIRVPMILSQPGALLAGQARDEMVDLCDLFQTLLDHCGIEIDEEERIARRYPGVSFRDRLRGDARRPWRNEVFSELGTVRMVRTRTHKLVLRYPSGPSELFDLERDPRETRSFFDDPGYAEVREDLSQRIVEHFARYEDPLRSGLRVRELPRHAPYEDWDWSGRHDRIATNTDWLEPIRLQMVADAAAEEGERRGR